LLTATRALDLRCDGGSLHAARGTGAVRDLVRTAAARPGPDRHLAPEIEAVTHLGTPGTVPAAGSAAVGHLACPPARPTPKERDAHGPRPAPRPRHARPRPRPARHDPHRAVVAERGAAADAHEQPRPRGRGA